MAKKQYQIKLIYDTREQDTSYVKDIMDNSFDSNGLSICYQERACVKPLGCDISTGDITVEYREVGTEEWLKTSLALELKKSLDLSSSIMVKDNFTRLCSEITRSKQANLDFYFLVTHSFDEIERDLKKLKKFKDTNVEIIFFEAFLKLDAKLRENGYSTMCVGTKNLGKAIRRIIKLHIRKITSKK